MYVDDIIVIRNDFEEIEKLKKQLVKGFEIKELGALKYFSGIEVAWSRNEIFISQQKYILGLLKETSILGCKPSYTPIEQDQKLGEISKTSWKTLLYISHKARHCLCHEWSQSIYALT